MTDEPIDKKIDNDWKRRAQQEKAQLDAQARPKGGSAARPAPNAGDENEGDDEGGGAGSLFASFVNTLAAQAAMFLGMEPDPMTGARRANPEQAKYLIDVLGVLEEKTRGNLTPDEGRLLQSVLHELRLAFVELTQAAARRAPPMPPPPRK